MRKESIAPDELAATPTSEPNPTSSSVHAGPDVRSAVERGVLVHGDALDERADDARLADAARAAVEQVAVEHGEVGELADLERAGLLVEVVDVRRAE